MKIVTFTNLFPSSRRPTHGLFVRERMQRVVAALRQGSGEDACRWSVVVPVPRVPGPLRRRAGDRLLAELPDEERVPVAAGGHDASDGAVRVRHVHYLHLPGLSQRAQARRVERACLPVVAAEREAAAGPVVLDAHYLWPDGVAALAIAQRLDLPCFVTARGSDVNVLAERPHVAARIRELAPAAAARFAVSEPLRARFEQIAGCPVELARNGVDLERFRIGDEATARRALGLPEGVPLVLGVGRLTVDKGFVVLARALRRMPASVHLVLVGDGPLRDELRASLPADRLHLLGSRPPHEVATAMQACDVLAFPSAREGWPNVVTEMLACGRPVVGTPVGAVPQMLSSPLVGALVRHDDPAALARELVRFLQRPPARERIRQHAERFGWDEPVAMLAERFRNAARAAS